MAVKRGGLGPRDLSFFISSETAAVTTQQGTENNNQQQALTQLALDHLTPGKYQPRKDMAEDRLQELADSIKAQGVIQPIIVRPLHNDAGRYEIIAGERRFRAARLAGLTQVPVVVKDIPDQTAMAIALIENIQREDLNPVEEAYALQRLLNEFGLTHEEIAKSVGKSRATVSNLLRVLTLETEVRTYLEHGDIELGHAKVLLALSDTQQIDIARQVIAKGLSVRETEKLVQQAQLPVTEQVTTAPAIDPDVQRLERNLAERLGAMVALKHQTSGKGKLIIKYNSLEELDGILEHIK